MGTNQGFGAHEWKEPLLVCLVPELYQTLGLVKDTPAHIRVNQTQLPREFLRLGLKKELNGNVTSAV